MKTIALLTAGSVSDEAAKHLFGDATVDMKYYRLISDVFMSTVNGKSDYSVIPIENTIDGSVSLHTDWLVHEVDIPVQAEWVYPSIQNVIGRREAFLDSEGKLDLTRIKKVISHPVALAQCSNFLREHMPDVETEHAGSTAEAVRIVRDNPDSGIAAIGTRTAAANNMLDVLASKVTDHSNNYTRFWLVGNEPFAFSKADHKQYKTSILVTMPTDYPGGLHQVLSAFAWRKINLSRIESRPTKKELGHYYFLIDLLMSLDSPLLANALLELEAIGCHVRVLGSYPSFTYEELL